MKNFFIISFLFIGTYLYSQENSTYQKPSKEILDLADVSLAPGVQIDSKGENMVLIYRNQLL